MKHDPYSNLYYRFFRIPLGRELGDIPHYAFPSDGNDFSVIVMDKDFKILNEVVFPGKKYKLEQAFVSKNGIYLPKTNSFDTNLNEDEVLYDIYKLF